MYPYINFINKVVIEPELLWGLYWGNGYTLQEIADIFGCGRETIRNRMIEYGIPCRGVTDFTFNDRQKEIFEGCMLGDSSLGWVTNNCRFANSDIHEEYLLWLQKQLGVGHFSTIKPDYRDGYAYSYVLTTGVIPSIRRDEFKRWYPYDTIRGTYQNRNNKIIPKDIELTPIKMLFWYIGDGQYEKSQYEKRCGVARFSNFLVYEDWLLLSKKVCKVLDVDSGISINKNRKDKDGIQRYRLRLGVVATRKFFDMVDSLDFDIPECYQYKFGV